VGDLNVIFVVILVGGWLGGWELAPLLRSTALIMILLRAGLGVRRSALARSGPTAAMHAFVPCVPEGSALTAILHILWRFPLFEAGAAAFMLTAVSPAVAVPSMLTLMEQGCFSFLSVLPEASAWERPLGSDSLRG
jgi:solute carrier family 9B (sodium/hydrogen exchanger), member 1/2